MVRAAKSVLGLLNCLVIVIMMSAAAVAAEQGKKTEISLGKKTVTLISASGEKLDIATVDFKKAEGGVGISVSLNLDAVQDEFLSMRPFRCIPDKKEMWCYLVYPHGLKRVITPTDLTDLEYSLLFIFRPPNDYGINAWNGLYFQLEMQDDGSIGGAVQEVDLNLLAVPPEEKFGRPISDADLTEVDPKTHRFARVEIR